MAKTTNGPEILVQKIALQKGEELMDFIDSVMKAVHSGRLSEFGVDPGDARLVGIFNDAVVVRDIAKGTFVRVGMNRTEKGIVTFSEPAETVKQAWVPASSDAIKKCLEFAEDATDEAVNDAVTQVNKAAFGDEPEVPEGGELVDEQWVQPEVDVWKGLLDVLPTDIKPEDIPE